MLQERCTTHKTPDAILCVPNVKLLYNYFYANADAPLTVRTALKFSVKTNSTETPFLSRLPSPVLLFDQEAQIVALRRQRAVWR